METVTLAPWKKSYDQPRQYIKKQRHYFANKDLSSQSYSFSSGHVWIWELDYKESWAKNRRFWKDWWWRWSSNTLTTWCEELTHAGKDWRQEEKGTAEDDMVGWYHRLNGSEFEHALRVGDGQGSLACCSPWIRKELDMTEQLNWTVTVPVYRTASKPRSGCRPVVHLQSASVPVRWMGVRQGESFRLRKCMTFTGSGTYMSQCISSLTVSLPLSYSCKQSTSSTTQGTWNQQSRVKTHCSFCFCHEKKLASNLCWGQIRELWSVA